MNGYTAADQVAPTWLTVSALSAAASSDGNLAGAFTMRMPTPASAYPTAAFPILYAFGPTDKAGALEIHPVIAPCLAAWIVGEGNLRTHDEIQGLQSPPEMAGT